MWGKGRSGGGGDGEDKAGRKQRGRGGGEISLEPCGSLDGNPLYNLREWGRRTSSPRPKEHLTKVSEQTITYNPPLPCRKADLNQVKPSFRNDVS